MSDLESQGNKPRSFAEICEEARKKAAESAQSDNKKGKGLEFMAYKISVARKHLELSVSRKITPAESNLLRLLELGTVGAQNSRSRICSKAEFFISDLSVKLGYKTQMKIWKLLKSLEAKEYIVREKTRSKGREILGLNPKEFGGQILGDRQHQVEKKRHLRLVDNSGLSCG